MESSHAELAPNDRLARVVAVSPRRRSALLCRVQDVVDGRGHPLGVGTRVLVARRRHEGHRTVGIVLQDLHAPAHRFVEAVCESSSHSLPAGTNTLIGASERLLCSVPYLER